MPEGSGVPRDARSSDLGGDSGVVETRTDQFITSNAMPGTMRPNSRA